MKKNYIKPSVCLIEMNQVDVVCGSGDWHTPDNGTYPSGSVGGTTDSFDASASRSTLWDD